MAGILLHYFTDDHWKGKVENFTHDLKNNLRKAVFIIENFDSPNTVSSPWPHVGFLESGLGRVRRPAATDAGASAFSARPSVQEPSLRPYCAWRWDTRNRSSGPTLPRNSGQFPLPASWQLAASPLFPPSPGCPGAGPPHWGSSVLLQASLLLGPPQTHSSSSPLEALRND